MEYLISHIDFLNLLNTLLVEYEKTPQSYATRILGESHERKEQMYFLRGLFTFLNAQYTFHSELINNSKWEAKVDKIKASDKALSSMRILYAATLFVLHNTSRNSRLKKILETTLNTNDFPLELLDAETEVECNKTTLDFLNQNPELHTQIDTFLKTRNQESFQPGIFKDFKDYLIEKNQKLEKKLTEEKGISKSRLKSLLSKMFISVLKQIGYTVGFTIGIYLAPSMSATLPAGVCQKILEKIFTAAIKTCGGGLRSIRVVVPMLTDTSMQVFFQFGAAKIGQKAGEYTGEFFIFSLDSGANLIGHALTESTSSIYESFFETNTVSSWRMSLLDGQYYPPCLSEADVEKLWEKIKSCEKVPLEINKIDNMDNPNRFLSSKTLKASTMEPSPDGMTLV